MNLQELSTTPSSRSLLTRLLPFASGHRSFQGPKSQQKSSLNVAPSIFKKSATALNAVSVAPTRAADHSVLEQTHLATSASQHTPRLTDATDLGFPRNLAEKYSLGRTLGSGGNGTVLLVVDRETGKQFACKSIPKQLSAEVSDKKKAGHIKSIQREIEVLTKLKGTLNVVKVEEVYEDDCHVHIIMEQCKGGELWHRVGDRHYSERTVASFMRAVLRTLAQCHSHHILHRDIKPGNFMLLDESDRAPLKAIDFGLATPYDQAELPRTDLGLEGTPWYMAPEVLSSRVLPESDIWSAGVMAYQLLSGFLPFDDHKRPHNPSLSAVWKSILTDTLNFKKPCWADISDEAKDFIKMLLEKDPEKRPTAKQALQHPWLVGGTSAERSTGRRLHVSVVQRIQRFAQGSIFKRSILQSIAAELLEERTGADGSVDEEGGMAIPVKNQAHQLSQKMKLGPGSVEKDMMAATLRKMGYRLAPSEAERLLQQVDLNRSGRIQPAALAASQVDWRMLQQSHLDAWLAISKRSFESLDMDCDGVIGLDEIVASLREKVPEAELSLAVQQALDEAKCSPEDQGIDFPAFLRMLRGASIDSLDQYDDRLSMASSSYQSLNLLDYDTSGHGSRHGPSRDNSRHGSSRDPSWHGASVGSSREGSRHGIWDGNKENIQQGTGQHHHVPVAEFNFGNAHGALHGAGQSAAKPQSLSQLSAAVPAAAATAFRFDVPKKAPPPTPAMVFRFDTPGQSGGHAGGQEEGSGRGRKGRRSGAEGAPKGASRGCALHARPGLQETRMHGSNLYRNACLPAVKE